MVEANKHMMKAWLAVLFISGLLGACGAVVKDGDIVSTVDTVNIPGEYVVIRAGRQQGVRIGSEFEISREYYVTAHAIVFEVTETTCKARGYRETSISDVLSGDKARLEVQTTAEWHSFLLLCALLTGFAIVFFSVFGIGYYKISVYAKRSNFWGQGFPSISFRCLSAWFWLIFFCSSFIIIWYTYLALFRDGLHIQDLMLLYPFAGAVMLITICAAWLLVGIVRPGGRQK